MKILTPENKTFEMNSLPDEIEDIRYCVLDVTDKNEPDFFFIPLVFIETFNAPSMGLKIDINWKWARFYINHEGDVEISTELTEMYSAFDEVTIDWMDSGTEIFTFYNLETNEVIEDAVEFNYLIEGYWEEGINALYDNGYNEEDPELWIVGGFSLETTEPPFEF